MELLGLELPEASFHSTKEKHQLAASAEQGEKQGGSWKQTVSAAVRNIHPNPLLGPASHDRTSGLLEALLGSHQGHTAAGNEGHQVVRIQQPHMGTKNCNWKQGPAALGSKPDKEAMLMERKVCFISDQHQGLGVGQTLIQRLTPFPPPTTPRQSWAWAFIDRGRGLHTETAVSFDGHFATDRVVIRSASSWLF